MHCQSLFNNTKIMESINNSNTLSEKHSKMTLKGYYKNLPVPTHPKKRMIQDLAKLCDVTDTTVRNWIKYGLRPNNPDHIIIISKYTGISPDLSANVMLLKINGLNLLLLGRSHGLSV